MNTEKNDPEIIKSIEQITTLVNKFNKSNDKFEIELHINKKEFEGYLRLDQIMTMVCAKSGLTSEYLNMKTRDRNIIVPRQIAHYLGAKRSKHSLSEIGAYFGGKDHATVLHSKRTIQNLLDTDKEFREKWSEFLNQ